MRLSTQYGLVGLGALALLSLGQWLRGRSSGETGSSAADYLLGVLPNFAAAIAIAFVLMSIWADQRPTATRAIAKRAFLICAAISTAGLLGWELIQRGSDRFIFDVHDIGATLVGIAGAGLFFHILTPRHGAH